MMTQKILTATIAFMVAGGGGICIWRTNKPS